MRGFVWLIFFLKLLFCLFFCFVATTLRWFFSRLRFSLIFSLAALPPFFLILPRFLFFVGLSAFSFLGRLISLTTLTTLARVFLSAFLFFFLLVFLIELQIDRLNDVSHNLKTILWLDCWSSDKVKNIDLIFDERAKFLKGLACFWAKLNRFSGHHHFADEPVGELDVRGVLAIVGLGKKFFFVKLGARFFKKW